MDLKQFNDLINLSTNDRVVLEVNQKNKSGNNSVEGNQIAGTIINISLDANSLPLLKELFGSVSNTDASAKVKEKVIPIENLISDGQTTLALEHYSSLLQEDDFELYSKYEKFLIYNGILNCHVNLNSNEAVIEKWSIKIEALGDVEDIHKYYYIKAIWKYNLGDLKVAKVLNEKSKNKNCDYINSLSFEILIKTRLSEIGYDSAVADLKAIIERNLSEKDISRTYEILGDVSFMNQKFREAHDYYKESNEYAKGATKELGIAVSLYHLSIKKIRPDGMVDFQEIDFEMLRKSKTLLEKVFDEKTKDFGGYTVNLIYSYLFNINSLIGEFNRTVEIVNKERSAIDFNNADIARLVVQAQVINKIYDEEVFSHLSDYDVIKYKSLYLEQCGEYNQVYSVLLPVIEGEYSSDKLLRLSFLNSLRQLDNRSEYFRYYKKFQHDEIDEVLWMNYIEYLEDQSKITEMINELRKIKDHISNPFIAISYMKMLARHKLYNDLYEFFENVNNGKYPIMDENKSMVTFEKLMLHLKKEEYSLFYSAYEELDLDCLRDIDRLILTVNYYNSKGDFSKCGKSYFELYKLEKNPNDLMKAVQNKIIANEISVAEMYLEFVNPMELKEPEMYYMFSAMALREKGKLSEAFEKLDEYKDFVEDIESPFHHFYFGFNISNGRLEEAMKYVGGYYEKNPNPKWFKIIKHEENETSEELINKLNSLTGPSPDYTDINNFYNAGLIGISVYSKITNRRLEDVISDKRYPLNKLHIAIENIEVSMKRAENLRNNILLDANTLIVLAKVNGLELLHAFGEVFISQETQMRLKKMEMDFIMNLSTEIIEFIDASFNVHIIPVDISIRDTSEMAKLLPDDTMSCLALSENMGIPFFNTEVSIMREFKSSHILDINAFFFHLKSSNPELDEKIAVVKRDLRKNGFNFISFDSDDILNVYKVESLDGIKPFIKMDKNSIYSTFLPQYMTVLTELERMVEKEAFIEVLAYFIRYFDGYLGKSKYYLSCLSRNLVTLQDDVNYTIQNCNLRTVFWFVRKAHLSEVKVDLFRQITGMDVPLEDLVYIHNIITKHDVNNKMLKMKKVSFERIQEIEYKEALKRENFKKISLILSFVAQFFSQILSAFGSDVNEKRNLLSLIDANINNNSVEDIEYLIEIIERVKNEKDEKDSKS